MEVFWRVPILAYRDGKFVVQMQDCRFESACERQDDSYKITYTLTPFRAWPTPLTTPPTEE